MTVYKDSDIDAAVAAGVLSADAAAALRHYIMTGSAAASEDEENFRLLSGFNDIFVAIAGSLLLVGAGWIGKAYDLSLSWLIIAVMAWGLAEYFTRVRRMALPSILFLFAFVGGAVACVKSLLNTGDFVIMQDHGLLLVELSATAAGAAALHWWRFHVPITIAAGVAALVGLIVGIAVATFPDAGNYINPLLLAMGVLVFLYAIFWDLQDPQRKTNKSDVAFWLHLLAAPLMVHPAFKMLGLLNGNVSMNQAMIVVALYIVMGIVALAIDRRALLVSGLIYVTTAMISLFHQFGAVTFNTALAISVIGLSLLLLSAFWHTARLHVLRLLPQKLRMKR